MGKKSKKNAGSRSKAEAKTGESSSSSFAAAAPSAVSTAATWTTTGILFDARNGFGGNGFEGNGGVLAIGGTTGSKKLKCVRCCSALKDLTKAHQCPGCAQLYCWRCEKKMFRECLNGKNCANPLWRCMDCTGGQTMLRLSGETVPFGVNNNLVINGSAYQRMVELIAKDERLSDAAIPFQTCSSPKCLWDETVTDEGGNGWNSPFECYSCASATDTSTCRTSYLRKCSTSSCFTALCTACDHDTNERMFALACDANDRQDSEPVLGEVQSKFPKALSRCQECKRDVCATCNIKGARDTSFVIDRNGFHTTCPPCTEKKYWSAKPCTNPTCPNEVGLPTKRCGGCHLDRYCSVECQGMAYPAHKSRCRAISAKRAAAAGK